MKLQKQKALNGCFLNRLISMQKKPRKVKSQKFFKNNIENQFNERQTVGCTNLVKSF